MPFPAHIPTDLTRAEVSALRSFGIKHDDIAKYIGIDPTTLVKYYQYELDTAVTKANAQVAQRLFNKATQQDDLQAQIFWLKTRGRWRTADKEAEVETNNETLTKIREMVNDLNKMNTSDI
jgi:thiamine pyrophosphate-dependent acetolactate synthase large subunit-like protein